MSVNIPEIKLVRTVWIFKGEIEDISAGAHIPHMTTNLIILRRCRDDNGKEIYQTVKCMQGVQSCCFC